MKVITVTLNPSLERTFMVHYLAVGYHNQSTQTTRLDPTGRGVNISRALHALEVETAAVILLGNDVTGRAYQALLNAEALPTHIVAASGKTRSSIVLLDTGNKSETIISEDNAGFSRDEIRQVASQLQELVEPDDYVVFAGPLPKDIPDETYTWLVEQAVEAGARVVLDLPLAALRQAIKARPEMVFMTQPETESYFNFPVRVHEDVIYCAHKLREEGAGCVLILLSHETGAILATPDETLLVTFPGDLLIGTHSGTVGAMLAGYITGLIKERAVDKSLRLGMAMALHTIQQVGSEFPRAVDLKESMRQVEVTPLPPADKLSHHMPPIAPPPDEKPDAPPASAPQG